MHLLIKKLTVRIVKAHWIDEEFENCIIERDGVKGVANKSGCTSDWLTYCKLRNDVTKLNKMKKLYYEAKINDIKYFKLNYGQKDKFNSIFHQIRWLIHNKNI